jgi:predicted ribosome quality control (RQC) complex YloA/Tae2 family protein
MSLDGAFLHLIAEELKSALNARVEKIIQPSRDEIVLGLFNYNNGIKTDKKLLISSNPMAARICFTDKDYANMSAKAGMFHLVLRKKLLGARLTAVEQVGLERILTLSFCGTNDLGDVENLKLIVEVIGRTSNVILTREDNIIIDALRRIDDVTANRRMTPGIPYESPVKQKRLSLLDLDRNELFDRLKECKTENIDRALIGIIEGVSPIFTRETGYFAARDTDVTCGEIAGDSAAFDRLVFFLTKALTEPVFCMVSENGKPRDFSFVNILQYGNAARVIYYNSACALIDCFFEEKAAAERSRQICGDVMRRMLKAYEKEANKIDIWRTELADCGKRDQFRIFGDMINANLYQIKDGEERLVTEDYITGEKVIIPLNTRISPARNAQIYYTKYKKMDTAGKKLTELIAEGEKELIYIDSVFDLAARAKSEAEIEAIKRELEQTGYYRGGNTKNTKNTKNGKAAKDNKKQKPLPPLSFTSPAGLEVLVGRNNVQNDMLTFKTAKPTDIWLHTQKIAGSHVILRTNGKKPDDESLLFAARLAARHSKGAGFSRLDNVAGDSKSGGGINVPVDYLPVKQVKKPPGSKPGYVTFTGNKTLFVNPEL